MGRLAPGTGPDLCDDLVSANRVLAHEGILGAYGHVSARDPDNPDRFLLARSRAPELVTRDDLLEFDLDGTPTREDPPALYKERFIHAALYAARPDVNAVCHNHAASLLPFCVSRSARLRAVVHGAGFLGADVPVWDIADEFGPGTDLLVGDIDQARSLARAVGAGYVALMRGHGGVIAAHGVRTLVGMSVSVDENARVLLSALALGEVRPLHAGEIAARTRSVTGGGRDERRVWDYLVRRAGQTP